MDNKIDLREIACYENLEYIETTSQANGYPANIKGAIIGFDSFEQAKQLAEEHGLSMEMFTRRDGWQLWHRTGNKAWHGFVRHQEDFGDDYKFFEAGDQFNYFENEVQDVLADCENFIDARRVLDDAEKVYDKICDIDDEEVVVTYCGSYYDTIEKVTMQYEIDTHHYAIGVILN